jgi:hypothetical protein
VTQDIVDFDGIRAGGKRKRYIMLNNRWAL